MICFDDILLIPKKGIVNSRKDVSLETNICGHTIPTPIVSANMSSVTDYRMAKELMRLGGLPVLHRMDTSDSIIFKVKNILVHQKTGVLGVSFGFNNWKEICSELLYDSPLNSWKNRIICFLDVAHAHSEQGLNFFEEFTSLYPNQPLVVGNIATVDAYEDFRNILINSDLGLLPEKYFFKVGIGSGSMCSTRLQTGFGMPTAESICEIRRYYGPVGLIADGGIKNSGDIVKSLALGANATMLGKLFAGTEETPGNKIDVDGKYYKIYRGSASRSDKELRGETSNIEGMETLVPYVGPVEKIFNELCDGIRSGISYGGCKDIKGLRNVNWNHVTVNGTIENGPHGLRRKD